MLDHAGRFTLPNLKLALVKNLLTVTPSTTVLEAIALMNQGSIDPRGSELDSDRDASCVWVVDNHQVVGVLTERDVVRLSSDPTALSQLHLKQVISRPSAILPETALTDDMSAAYLLQHDCIDPIAIVDAASRLVGMITRESVWTAIASQQQTLQNKPSLAALEQNSVSSLPRLASRSDSLLKTILEGALAGYWSWDIANNTQYYSPGFKRMFGYAEHELPNTPETWQRLIAEEDLPLVLASFDHHVKSGGQVPFENEVRYYHKDGSTVWVLCSGLVAEWDEQGNPAQVIGCHVDITKRKQAELDLQNTKEELENFFLVALDLLCIADVDGHFRRVNQSWEKVLGYSAEELEGQSFLNFVHPDDLESTLAAIATLKKQETIQSFVNRYRRKDGSYRHIEWYSRPYGSLIYAAARDITQQRLADTRLRKSEAHFKTAQRIAGLGSWEFEVSTGQITWSDEVYEIFDRDPALGPPTYEELLLLYHPEDREYHDQIVQQAMITKQPYDLECRALRPDGSIVYLQARGESIVDRSGQIMQIVGTILDITNRKLWETKLLQATTQLEASNRELEAFAYSVSHDLRSPLRAIDGFSRALLEDYGDRFDAEAQDYFDRIRHNVKRMGILIDDLLRLSRVSRSEMKYDSINLSKLVEDQFAELQATDPRRQVKLVAAPNVTVWADVTLMSVMISNLLQNAWKFTSHHETAQIEFGHTQVNGQLAYFIKDDGAGFDMTYADMLFGVFQRLHNTDEFPGTGIGLATVQRAIHRHGGQVWAEGAIEQGATVYFTLPLVESVQRG